MCSSNRRNKIINPCPSLSIPFAWSLEAENGIAENGLDISALFSENGGRFQAVIYKEPDIIVINR